MLPDSIGRRIRTLASRSWWFLLALLIGPSVTRTLKWARSRKYHMGRTIRVSGKTIEVSEEFYEQLETQQQDDESMEETLRRVAGGPHPSEVAGLFTPEEAERMKEAVTELRTRDRSRLERAREAFAEDE